MKFCYILSVVASASLALAMPVEDGSGADCASSTPLSAESSCTHGQYACIGDDTAVCNWGNWYVTACGQGNRCMPDDYECVPESQYDSVYSMLHPVQTPEPV